VDSRTAILEELENNNIKRWQQQILIRDPAPDFAASEVNTPPLAAAGELLTVARRIDNLGNAAGVAPYAVLISADNDIDLMHDRVIAMGMTRLDAFGTDEGIDSVRIPSDVTAGTYYVGYILDPMAQVTELNEMNNKAVSTR